MESITEFLNLAHDWLTTPLFSSEGSNFSLANLVGLLFIIVFAWWGAATLEKLMQRATKGKSYKGIDESTLYLLGRLIRYTVWVVATLMGLSYIGFNLSGLAFLGGAIGVGIGFGLQNIFSNFMSGIILIVERSLKIGDFVEMSSGATGVVNEIGLRFTRITTRDNVDIIVPNSEFINGQVINWSFSEKSRRIHIPFGVAYGCDKDQVKEAALEAANRIDGAIVEGDPRRKPEVWLVEFGDNSLNFELVIWVGNELMSRPKRTQALFLWEIETELRKRNIEIPFPQRDLHVRSGVLDVRVQRQAD